MFLLIWFKAGLQTSPPIIPLDRETQVQPTGKLLPQLYSRSAIMLIWGPGADLGPWTWTHWCLFLEHTSPCELLLPIVYRRKEKGEGQNRT